jgi:DNA-binding MarR family transcriptional regulator
MQKYLDALIKTLGTPEDAARALANVLVFESLADDQMRAVRDTCLPSVLSWAAEAASALPVGAAPEEKKFRDVPKQVLALLKIAPGLTLGQLHERLGGNFATVQSATKRALVAGRLRREHDSSDKWRYSLTPDASVPVSEAAQVPVEGSTPARVLALIKNNPGIGVAQLQAYLPDVTHAAIDSATRKAIIRGQLRRERSDVGQKGRGSPCPWRYFSTDVTAPVQTPALAPAPVQTLDKEEAPKTKVSRAPAGNAKVAFEYLKLHPKSTPKEVREGANLPYESVQCSLRFMEKRGLLVRETSGRSSSGGTVCWRYSVAGAPETFEKLDLKPAPKINVTKSTFEDLKEHPGSSSVEIAVRTGLPKAAVINAVASMVFKGHALKFEREDRKLPQRYRVADEVVT